MSFLDLSMHFAQWNVEKIAIRNAIRQKSYSRCIARQKPPLTDAQNNQRLEWALSHLNWNLEEWFRVLWSDETYICDAWPSSPHVTRKISLRILILRWTLTSRTGSLRILDRLSCQSIQDNQLMDVLGFSLW